MSDRIKEYRLQDNLCTLLGFDSKEVKAIHLYASISGEIWYKVVGTEEDPQGLVPVEVENWYKVNKLNEQRTPLTRKEASLENVSFQPLGQIYPYIVGVSEEGQYK